MQTSHVGRLEGWREGGGFTYGYGTQPRELSVLQCDEDVEMWFGIWEASLMTSSCGSGRHTIYLY